MALDPVGGGIVESLARPGGNTTGFMQFEYSLSGKWLELLKQMTPNVTRAGIFRDPTVSTGIGQFAVLQAVAPPLGVEVIPINLRDAAEIERAVATFARSPNGGLIVTGRRRVIAIRSSHWRRGIVCPPSTPTASSSLAAVWFPMGLICWTSSGRRLATSTASLRREAGRSAGAGTDQVRDGP